MRRVTFGCGTSVDHFIARVDHSVDWLRWGPEVAALAAEFWTTIDAVVMGRKTWEVAARAGTPAYPGVRNYLCSRSLRESPHPQVELVEGDAAAFLARLRDQPGRGICVMGGGELARAFFEAGLIDEVGLNLHPVLPGDGIPLFHRLSRPVELELLEARPFGDGCALLRYVVRRDRETSR